MCLTPMQASVVMSFLGSSFTNGITGSMRTETGIPLMIKFCTALRRSVDEGACGSRILAKLSSSVVMVNATAEGTFESRSSSRVTMLLFVIIWIRQLFTASTSRHFRVHPAFASMRGYGSEELLIETISPLSFIASRLSACSRSFLGRQSAKFCT